MNSFKLFSIVCTFVLFSVLVLAVPTLVTTTPSVFTKSDNSTSFTITPNAPITVTSITAPSFTSGSNTAQVQFSFSQGIISTASTINANLTGQLNDFPVGRYSTTATITYANASDTSDSATQTVALNFNSGFCDAGQVGGNLSITDVDISAPSEDNEWERLDVVTIDVEVENNGNDDIDDVIVQLGLFDSSGKNVIGDLDFMNSDEEEIDLGSLGEDDNDQANFEFRVPADFDESSDYKLAVKVYSDDVGEEEECADTSADLSDDIFESISVIAVDSRDEDETSVIVDEIMVPSQVTCGELVTGSFGVFNIGDEDEDQVLIDMRIPELGVDQEFIIRDNLDQGDDKTLDFSFRLPEGANDGTYTVRFRTHYDYDDNDDTYDIDAEDEFTQTFQVIGCGTGNGGSPSMIDISPSLASGAHAGESLVVNALITNRGTTAQTITLSALSYQSWASLESISDSSLSLDAGESQTVTLTFNVDSDASGEQSFVIQTSAAGAIDTQEVQVEIESDQSGVDFDFFQGSGLIWVIGAINLVLIILIIVVAVKLARR